MFTFEQVTFELLLNDEPYSLEDAIIRMQLRKEYGGIPFLSLTSVDNAGLTITDDASTDVGTLTGATLTISTSTGTFVFVGETSITLAVGETSIVTSTYSVKNSSTTDVAVKLTRSTVSGAGTPGTDIGFAASTPPAANTYISTAVNERETGLGSGTYFYKLWKVATPVAGTENYAVIVVKH